MITLGDYDTLYREEVAKCTRCHTLPLIQELLKGDAEAFRYRWHSLREGVPPYKFVFVAMEPTSEYDMKEEYPQDGGFDVALRFAINQFLFGDEPYNYLITNMAKCSMRVGRECNETRPDRCKACAVFPNKRT